MRRWKKLPSSRSQPQRRGTSVFTEPVSLRQWNVKAVNAMIFDAPTRLNQAGLQRWWWHCKHIFLSWKCVVSMNQVFPEIHHDFLKPLDSLWSINISCYAKCVYCIWYVCITDVLRIYDYIWYRLSNVLKPCLSTLEAKASAKASAKAKAKASGQVGCVMDVYLSHFTMLGSSGKSLV